MWEFIRDILLTPERNPGLIKWEDRTAGVFRFLKSEAVAQLWGRKKNNSSMTYEKLSRAMRYTSNVYLCVFTAGNKDVQKKKKKQQSLSDSCVDVLLLSCKCLDQSRTTGVEQKQFLIPP